MSNGAAGRARPKAQKFASRLGAAVVVAAGFVVPIGSTTTLAAPEAVYHTASKVEATTQSARIAFASYLSYHGGMGDDNAVGVKVDAAGYIYVVGTTSSGLTHPSIFVAKLEPSGKNLLYTTLLNAGCESDGGDIALDRAGNAYITGRYVKKDSNGTCDVTEVEVAKLSGAGVPLYSVQFGGQGGFEAQDWGNGITVDQQGDAYVTGHAYNDAAFPTTPGAFMKVQPDFGGPDAFVLKVNPTGKLVYSTVLRGNDMVDAEAIAVDSRGDAFVTGQTGSTDFPTTTNAYERRWTKPHGVSTAFVTVLNAAGSAPIYSTYLSGNDVEQGLGITVDQQGTAYVDGATDSSNFPTTANAFSRSCGRDGHCGLSVADQGGCLNGCTTFNDGFVAEINPKLLGKNSLVYATYLGGTLVDQAQGIAVDSARHIFVTGATSSTNFPTVGAVQAVHGDAANPLNPNLDCFVAELDPAKSGPAGLRFATFLGGKGVDYGGAIALGHGGAVYVVGTTNSTDFPVASALQGRLGGGNDAFVAKIIMTS